jgi:histidyl-tRNA synthetase
LYPDAVKLKKQISYANKKEIPYVALVGDEEIKLNKITLKKMSDGSQNTFDINDLIKKFAK